MIIPASQTNAGTYFHHYDGLGSVVALSKSDGTIAAQYSYDALVFFLSTVRCNSFFISRVISQLDENGPSKKLVGVDAVKFRGGTTKSRSPLSFPRRRESIVTLCVKH